MVVPQGPISAPMANLRALIAHCDVWRTWVGGSRGMAAVKDAADRIFLIEPTAPTSGLTYSVEELKELRPYMVIEVFAPHTGYGGNGFEPVRIALDSMRWAGQLLLSIEDNLADEDQFNVAEAMMLFLNNLGLTLEEMAQKCNGDNYLDQTEIDAGINGIMLRKMSMYYPVTRPPESAQETQGDFWKTGILIDHGR